MGEWDYNPTDRGEITPFITLSRGPPGRCCSKKNHGTGTFFPTHLMNFYGKRESKYTIIYKSHGSCWGPLKAMALRRFPLLEPLKADQGDWVGRMIFSVYNEPTSMFSKYDSL